MKILNLYAGIGGNRKLWGDDYEITAVEFDSDIASQTFNKRGRQTYLLDEIYDRTLKMERERRYCMRYLRPCFSLDRIKIEIVIQNADPKKAHLHYTIPYTLEENGYPK